MSGRRLLLAALLFCALGSPAAAATGDPDRTPWVTDYATSSTATSGGFTYLAGGFTLVGPRTGQAVPVAAATGRRLDRFPEVLRNGGSQADLGRVNGSVHAVVPDGRGGWYLGGGFTRVGGLVRNGVAHVNPDGSVDQSFRADANGTVYALAVVGSTVYAGGDFSAIAGRARNRVAALDAATGAARSWNPDLRGDAVLTMAVHGQDLIVGGSFYWGTRPGPARLAAIDMRTGAPRQWDTNPDSQVNSIAVDGDTVYVGGLFNSVGGAFRKRVGAVDATTGRATEWDPCFDCGGGRGIGNVNAIAVADGVVYAGGALNYVGGQWRSNIAALDTDGIGLATAWNPGADDEVFSLDAEASTVYAGGRFGTLGGRPRARAGAVGADGRTSAWTPEAGGVVTAISRAGDTVYLGGEFQTVNGVRRGGLAKLGPDGRPTSWNPGTDGEVWQVEAAPDGSLIYVSGLFTRVGGADRSYVAALDPASGAATAFNARANLYGFVHSMTPGDGTLYVGGEFNSIGGAGRERIAALDPATGDARSFNPRADGIVRNLALDGTTLYATGDFARIAGASRSGLAALNATTGAATSFNPAVEGGVRTVLPTASRIYFAGGFTRFAGQPRTSLAAIDRSTGNLTAWNPRLAQSIFTNRPPGVTHIGIHGSALYAAGDFTEAAGETRTGLAAFDLGTGGLTAWDPYTYGYSPSLRADASGVTVAGEFHEVSGVSSNGVARFGAPATGPASPQPFILRATASGASTNGELPVVTLSGTAGQAGILSAYQHKPGVACSESPTTEQDDLRLTPTVNGAQVYGDYVQPAAIQVAEGERAVLCAYLSTYAGVKTRAAVEVVGRGGTAPDDPAPPRTPPSEPPAPTPADGGSGALPGDTGPSLPGGMPPAAPAQPASFAASPASASSGSDAPRTPAAAARPCRVPRVLGKPLAVARLVLNVNGCKLGRTAKKRGARGALVVARQSPRAGARLRSGAKVSVVLANRKPRATRR